MGNLDDLLRQIREDEVKDKIELSDFASVSEFAQAIGEQPQLVHYYIRTGKIDKKPCECCGRPVINVEQAKQVFANRKKL